MKQAVFHRIAQEVLQMRTGIHPIDIEEMERNKQPWNPHYMASVLSDLISRQRGYRVDIILTPKEEKGR